MTAERKKALLVVSATFVIGVLIGVLATGFFAREHYRGRDGKGGRKEIREGRRGTLTDKIFKVVKADSSQKKLMRPIIDQTISRLDEVEDKSNLDAYVALDSLRTKLKPILAADQME